MSARGEAPAEEACYWLARSKDAASPPLTGPTDADVVIVGAGLTGLWTAFHLLAMEPGLDVAILEQGRAAGGASGRNAGILGEGIDHSHALAIKHFGRAEAQLLTEIGRRNVAEMRRSLEKHAIDCDLETTGQLLVALSEDQVQTLEAVLESARSLGVSDYRILDKDAVRAEIHCERYLGALLDPTAAILDPVKLVLGLKRVVLASGARLWERTRVRRMTAEGAHVRVSAGAGHVRARRAILATNAFTHQVLPRLRHRFIPFYDYILVSEPLAPAQREAIGWRRRQGVVDARSFFKYYRLTADGRILWGTSEAEYYPKNRVDPSLEHSPSHFLALKESFLRHFPALEGLQFPYAWGGPIAATTRFTPFFGSDLKGLVLYALGYTGHGLGTTHLAGKILAHQALGRSTPLLDLSLVQQKPFPYPPEPLRSWAVAAVKQGLRRVDAGGRPSWLLRILDSLGIGLSS